MAAASRWIILTLLLLATAACGPMYPENSPDPNLAAAGAHATLAAATAGAQSTLDAQMRAAATATMSAAKTQQASDAERELIEVAIQGTQQAVSAMQTVGAATAQAEDRRATATAVVVSTATEGAREASTWRATETAIALSVQREQKRSRFQTFLYWFGGISLIALAILVGIAVNRLVDWYIVWQDRRNLWFESTRGLILFIPGPNGELVPTIPGQVVHQLPRVNAAREIDRVYPLNGSGSVLMSAPAPRPRGQNTVHRQAIDLIDSAIEFVGNDTDTIPGWRDLDGWSSSTWQRVIAALVAYGLVETNPGSGTYVTEKGGGSLEGLRYLLVSKQVHLRPTPQGGSYA